MWTRIRLTLEMIKFEHSIFALPFALTGALLAIRDGGLEGTILWRKIAWIVVAAVFLYDISVVTGQFEIMKDSVAAISRACLRDLIRRRRRR